MFSRELGAFSRRRAARWHHTTAGCCLDQRLRKLHVNLWPTIRCRRHQAQQLCTASLILQRFFPRAQTAPGDECASGSPSRPIQITAELPYKSLPNSHTNHWGTPIQITGELPYKSLPLSQAQARHTLTHSHALGRVDLGGTNSARVLSQPQVACTQHLIVSRVDSAESTLDCIGCRAADRAARARHAHAHGRTAHAR